MDEPYISEKTNAILRLVSLSINWQGWINFNEEQKRMQEFLEHIVEDIYQGYITYDAFEDTFITVSERIGRADSDMIDDCLLYVKKKIISKYSRVDYLS